MKLDRKDKVVSAVKGEIFDFAMKKYGSLMETANVFVLRYDGTYYQLKPETKVNLTTINFTVIDGRKQKNVRAANVLLYVESLK